MINRSLFELHTCQFYSNHHFFPPISSCAAKPVTFSNRLRRNSMVTNIKYCKTKKCELKELVKSFKQ